MEQKKSSTIKKIIAEYSIVITCVVMSFCALLVHSDFQQAIDLESKLNAVFQMLIVFYFGIMFLAIYLDYLVRQLPKPKLPQQ